MRIYRDRKEIELTPEELNTAYKEQAINIERNNKRAVAKLTKGQDIEFNPLRQMYRICLDDDVAQMLAELIDQHPEKFVHKPIVVERNGHAELAFDRNDLDEIKIMFAEVTRDTFDDRAVIIPDYEPIDIYQKSPDFMEGSFRFHDEKVRFEMDRRDGWITFEPHDYARLTRDGALAEAEMIAQIMTTEYVRDAIEVARTFKTPDEIVKLYGLRERDLSDPLMKEMREWELDIAYNDFANVYMTQLKDHDPVKEIDQVKKLQYASALMNRGLVEKDEKVMKEGFAIASDAISAITHKDIEISSDPAKVNAIRTIAADAQWDVRDYLADSNAERTMIREHIEKSMTDHDFWDLPNGDRMHQTTTREKSIDIERSR